MMRLSRVSRVWVLVILLLPIVVTAESPAPKPAKRTAYFVAGGGEGGTWLKNDEFQANMRKGLVDHRIVFWENGVPGEIFLKSIKVADILYFSGHSGHPKKGPPTQVLAAGVAPKCVDLIMPDEIHGALEDGPRPRLVVIDGCCTTDPEDGVPVERRLATAFRIDDNTRGRAYLGWSRLVPGFLGDRQIGRVLTEWTKPGPNGAYPTIDEAQKAAGVENLQRIGDPGLRYRDKPGFKKADIGSIDERFAQIGPGGATQTMSGPDDRADGLFAVWNNPKEPKIQDWVSVNIYQEHRADVRRTKLAEKIAFVKQMHDSFVHDAAARRGPDEPQWKLADRTRFSDTEAVCDVTRTIVPSPKAKEARAEVYARVEAIVEYRDVFLIYYSGTTQTAKDLSAEMKTILQRAKELTDARFPPEPAPADLPPA